MLENDPFSTPLKLLYEHNLTKIEVYLLQGFSSIPKDGIEFGV